MREINKIIVHTSASSFGNAELIDSWHRERGWRGIGYHYVILNGVLRKDGKCYPSLDGFLEFGRSLNAIGAHVRGFNTGSLGVCMIGMSGDFTQNQLATLNALCRHWDIASFQHSDFSSAKPYCAGLVKRNNIWCLREE